MWSLLFLCLPLGIAVGVLVVARFGAALFSAKSAQYIQKRPGLHLASVFLAISLVYVGYYSRRLPPAWVERRSQREFVFTNVEARGGWPAFEKECDFLITYSRTSEQHQWFPHFGDPLPKSCGILSALQAREVQVVTRVGKPTYVSIQVFDMHRTGGRDTPYYGLVYQQTTNADECVAADLFYRVRPRKLVDSIFEVY